jgi:hypothetical protein
LTCPELYSRQSNLKFEELSEFESKIENISEDECVALIGLIAGKTRG